MSRRGHVGADMAPIRRRSWAGARAPPVSGGRAAAGVVGGVVDSPSDGRRPGPPPCRGHIGFDGGITMPPSTRTPPPSKMGTWQ
jgi:hypothetical protein